MSFPSCTLSHSRLPVSTVPLLLALGLAPTLAAQPETPLSWRRLGPEGGGVTALAFVDDASGIVYAGTDGGGLSRSSDGGATWEALSASPTGRITAVAVDPTDPHRLLLTLQTAPFGLWRSSDAGETWDRVPFDPEPSVFFDVAFDPVNPRTVYAGSLDGLHRSTDGGGTWPELFTPPEEAVFELALDPGDPDTIFTVFDNRLYKSTDSGETFHLVLTEPQGYLAGLVFDPVRPGTVWVGGQSVFRSSDGGASWSPVAGSPEATDLVVDPRDGTLFAGGLRDGRPGVFRSTDGITWTRHDEGLDLAGLPVHLAVDPAEPGRLLAGTPDGIFVSDDRGGTWTGSQTGFEGHLARAFAASPRDPDLLLAATDLRGTLFRSVDGGTTWNPTDTEFVEALEISPADPSRVWAFTSGSPGPVITSTDGGRTFEGVGEESFQSFGTTLLDLEAHPTDPDQIAVGVHRRFSEIFEDLQAYEIWTTLDGGETWTQVWDRPEVPVHALAIEELPSGSGNPNPSVLWVATVDRLFRIAPGASPVPWSQFPEISPIRDLVLAGATLFVVGNSEILRTDPSRKTGTRVDGGLPAGRILDPTVDPLYSSLYVAVDDTGVFRTTDLGDTWQPVGPVLPRITGGLAVTRSQPQLLRAATRTGIRELALVPTCVPDGRTLCFQDGRFRVTVDWQDFDDGSGIGHSVPLEEDTGAFWFFHPNNLELMVKVLDGRPVNASYWVFVGALSNVAYTLRIEDTATGRVRRLANPAGKLASTARTDDFPTLSCSEVPCLASDGSAAGIRSTSVPPGSIRGKGASSGVCVPDARTLCLQGGRFAVRVDWEDFAGTPGAGRPRPITDDTGSFWFFRPENLELMVKVLDGRAVNGHFWVFLGALSNVAYTVEVTDTETGAIWRHENPAHGLASVASTLAFPVEGSASAPGHVP